MSRSYTDETIKLLWGKCAGRCAYPGCGVRCFEPKTDADKAITTGEIAHIYAYSSGGPRSKAEMHKPSKNDYENLIVLCRNHHRIVDAQSNAYKVDELFRWKQEIERDTDLRINAAMPSITFEELRTVVNELMDVEAIDLAVSFTLTPPIEKMQKNNLSPQILQALLIGMSQGRQVSDFIVRMETVRSRFPERLKNGFVQEYNRLVVGGLSGDTLFEYMRVFACSGYLEANRQAAALAVLVYLFVTCEIFTP